jgi:hypothetical protein
MTFPSIAGVPKTVNVSPTPGTIVLVSAILENTGGAPTGLMIAVAPNITNVINRKSRDAFS